MTVHDDRSLLALQGPAAAEALQVRLMHTSSSFCFQVTYFLPHCS